MRDHSKEIPSRFEPVIAITMGDPMGIGPEVVAKALCDPAILRLGKFVVYGQNQPLVDAADRAGTVSYTHLRAHETGRNLVCRLLLEKKKKK